MSLYLSISSVHISIYLVWRQVRAKSRHNSASGFQMALHSPANLIIHSNIMKLVVRANQPCLVNDYNTRF